MVYNDGFCFFRNGPRTETLWHDQGNTIIIAGESRFRVYQGMLATGKDTTVLTRMQAKSKPVKDGSSSVTVVNTDDAPLDMYHFLRAFYDGLKKSTKQSNEADLFDALSGILRLSTKYEVDEFKQFVTDEFSSYYPRTLSSYSQRKLPSSSRFHVEALNLFEEIGSQQFIGPLVCIICTSFTPTDVLSGVDGVRITHSLRLKCLVNMRLVAVTLGTALIRASNCSPTCAHCQGGLKLLRPLISPLSQQNPTPSLDVLGTLSSRQNPPCFCAGNCRRHSEGIALWQTLLSRSLWARYLRPVIYGMCGLLLQSVRYLWRRLYRLPSPIHIRTKETSQVESVRYCRTAEGKKVSLYIEDGDLAIGVENTIFSVYAGFLKTKSGVFRDMFDATNASVQTVYDRKPYMELEQEVAIDVYHFLMAIHKPNDFFHSRQSSTFKAISGMLRLSMKYDVPDLRREMVEVISKYFPASLTVFRKRNESFDTYGRPFRLIKLALQHGSPLYLNLPPILYCCYSNYDVQQSYNALQDLDLLESDIGKQYMQAIVYSLPLRELYIISTAFGKCSSCTTCNPRRTKALERLGPKFGLHFRLRMGTGTFMRQFGHLFCPRCKWTAQEALITGLDALWDDLPSYFMSSDWSRMRAVDRRDRLV